MSSKAIILLFMLIFSTSFSIEIKMEERKNLEKDISNKEIELKELKKLLEKLEKKKDEDKNPKIGLVLSGGGAKGLAHIGVLKVLEEYNIQIDYITGTSFGSIIGALYASGYTANEIEKIVYGIDWNSYKSNKQDREYTSLLSKSEKEKYFLNLEVDKNWGLRFPKGVLTGQSFYLELKSLLARVEGVDDFDNLKIPFRAITTNINTGMGEAQGKGDLAKAVFKSMAFPTVFEPIEDDGEFYVDGGVVDNMPVEEAIRLGADVIIAVDISADENIIQSDSSLVEIMDKMSTYKNSKQFKKSIELANILIVPDVKKYSVSDFSDIEILIKKGEIETRKHKEELIKYNRGRKKRISKFEQKKIEFEIEKIELLNNNVVNEKKIIDLSGKKLPNKYSQREFKLWMNKINALSIINRFFYRIENKKLIIEVQEKGAKHLRLGLNISSDFGVALKIATEVSNYDISESEYTIAAEISKYPKLELREFSEYKLKRIQSFSSLGVGVKTSPIFIYEKKDKISEYNAKNFYVSSVLGIAVFNSYALGIKGEYIVSKIEYDSGSKKFGRENTQNYYKGSLFIKSDTKDDSYFSNIGVRDSIYAYTGGDLEGKGDVEFHGFLFDLHRNIPIKTKFNLEIFTSGGVIKGAIIPQYEYYKIGGLRNDIKNNQFSFYGMDAMKINTEEFYMSGINLRYKLNGNLYLNARYNVITYSAFKELYDYDQSQVGEDFKSGMGLGLEWDSLVGPFEVVVSNNTDSHGSLFSFFFGYEF